MRHRHEWDFETVMIGRPRRFTPAINVIYRCSCGAQRTVNATPRIPSPDALSDWERFEKEAARRQKASYRSTWGDAATEQMIHDGVEPAQKER